MTELAPIVGQTTLSDEQRPAIIAAGDVAVTAGAGAGKTRTLVARYLLLLDKGLSPRQVVAITFTKKAAREMRNRVRKEVSEYLSKGSDLSAGELERWRNVHDALDAARIGTIHSLCGEILRRHPAEAGLDPGFEMLDEGQMALLQAQAVEEALVWAADDVHAARLFRLWPERELRTRLSDLVQKRLDVDEALHALPDTEAGLRDKWQTRLAAARDEALISLLSAPEFDAALDLVRAAEPKQPDDKLALQIESLLSVLGAVGVPSVEDLAVLGEIKLNVGSAKNWPGGKDEVTLLKDALKTLREGWKTAKEWLTLEWNDADQALLDHYGALRAIYRQASQRYEALKKERPALDFDDLEAEAVRLLTTHNDVAEAWQSEIAALLVDEFQDTNRRQRDLLDALNGGATEGRIGKLFIVGDGKQSIYRFRGADVSVFREKHQEIRASGQAFDLSTSYRGHRALIEALNALLEPVLGSEEDAARPYVEPFSPIDASRSKPKYDLPAPYVELHLALGSKSAGALENAAKALVSRLVELVKGDPELGYGDVALLCRATRSFPPYERAFEEAGVPFVTVAGRGFYERPEVRDLLNALQALDDPTDDLALAGLLRSPACSLSDIALLRLVEARRDLALPSLWDALCAVGTGEGARRAALEKETDRAARACALIAQLHAQIGRVPVAGVLKAFLDATAYRAALLRAGQARGARNVTKLLADAQKSERVSVGAFLDYLAQLRDVGTREGEAFSLSQGAVQIMSVHAAKGLEFPIVCIGDAGRSTPKVRGTVIDKELGVLPYYALERLAVGEEQDAEVEKLTSALYQLALHAVHDQDEAESGRLLYVAATRAQERLLISGTARGSADGWLKRLGGALPLAELLKQTDQEGVEIVRETWMLGEQPVACTLYPQNAELVLRQAASRPQPAPLLPDMPRLLRPVQPAPVQVDEEAREQARDPPRRVWRVVPPEGEARAPAWVVGQLVHGALADWLFPGGEGRDYTLWAAAEARGYGITDEAEVKDAVDRAAEMLTRFEGHPLKARMEEAAERRQEVPYALIDAQGRLDKGIIDALFREPDGWTVVEFKTDRIKDKEALEETLAKADYVQQVGRYLDAGERLLGVRPKPVLCLLNYGGTVWPVEDRW